MTSLLADLPLLAKDAAPNPTAYSQALRAARQQLAANFYMEADIQALLYQHSAFIDSLLCQLWEQYGIPDPAKAALVAVGGYGRKELHPASDIDLLILLAAPPAEACREQLAAFITLLWDIGLEIGHSVRTLEECAAEARADLTVITNLMEARLLCGNALLFQQLQAATAPGQMWDARQFLLAKLEEQHKRHARFGDTSHRVEPNLKEGCGGLRDIHTVGWVAQRAYGTFSLQELHRHGLLEDDEYQALQAGRDLLWRIRFVLHGLAQRKEDRLLFDYQRSLAQRFGHTETSNNAGVEAFMQRYHRTITELERLCTMLMALLRERILNPIPQATAMLGEWYQRQGELLAVSRADTFELYPTALLEIFLWLQRTPEVVGLTPQTSRLIRRNLHRIDSRFRQQARHRQLFIQILRQPHGVTRVMRLMNQHGILAAYLPAFANIVGRMQYDLFHMYTVDEHTLLVLRNLRRYGTAEGAAELPLCAEVFHTIQQPELLYLAGLFHDIAKGRHGDHSELGAEDAYHFCREHGLNLHEASFVAWLVRHHLLMSMTAQRKDISDPAVIREFAATVTAQSRLDYLFLLTVADIRATNPNLWSSWKQALLSELYLATRRVLQNHLPAGDASMALIAEKRTAALEQLRAEGYAEADCLALWERLGSDYHLQHSVEVVVWHTQHLLRIGTQPLPLAQLRTARSSSILFVYSPHRDDLFFRVVASLEQLNLNVLQARITTTADQFDLHTLHILGPDNRPIQEATDQQHILATLHANLTRAQLPRPQHRKPRILRNFTVPTRIAFNQLPDKQLTLLEINTGDMPGLLSRLGEAMEQLGIRVHKARINTLGEQAQDIFYITWRDGSMVTDLHQQQAVRTALEQALQTT